jgi:hypothetical protein
MDTKFDCGRPSFNGDSAQKPTERSNMKTPTHQRASDQIYRLRQEINREENRGKLRDLVSRLQIALNEEQARSTAQAHMQRRETENPFDRIILG